MPCVRPRERLHPATPQEFIAGSSRGCWGLGRDWGGVLLEGHRILFLDLGVVTGCAHCAITIGYIPVICTLSKGAALPFYLKIKNEGRVKTNQAFKS